MSPCGLESGEEVGYGPIFTAVTTNFSWDRYIDVSEHIIKKKNLSFKKWAKDLNQWFSK